MAVRRKIVWEKESEENFKRKEKEKK